MSSKYIVSHMDQQIGPFDEAELKSRWLKGELLPIDYVFDEAKNDWVLLAERFEWAGKPDDAAPPPVNADHIKRRPRPELSLAKPAPQNAQPEPLAPAKIENTFATAVTLVPEHQESSWQAEASEITHVSQVHELSAAKSMPTAQVQLTNGTGEVDLSLFKTGKMQVVARSGDVALEQPLKIEVKPMQPVEVVWNAPASRTVGEELVLEIKALDHKGAVCVGYTESFLVQVRGAANQDIKLSLTDGIGSLLFHHTKAEVWNLHMAYSGPLNVKLPQNCKLEWLAGPATHLVLDGPQEHLAGSSLKVKVRAVDKYGNVATTYQGTVALEVKAS